MNMSRHKKRLSWLTEEEKKEFKRLEKKMKKDLGEIETLLLKIKDKGYDVFRKTELEFTRRVKGYYD